MKKRRNVIVSLFLGAVAGWFAGYLRWPAVQSNQAFLLGVLACGVAVGIIFMLNGEKKRSNQQLRIHQFLFALLFLSGWLLALYYYNQMQTLTSDLDERNKVIGEQNEYIAASRSGNQDVILKNILDILEEAHGENSGKTLSDSTLQRISSLSALLLPYRVYLNRNLAEKIISPQKGQLLVAICAMPLDSINRSKLISKVNFSGADLRGANLKGQNLQGINLKGCVLRDGQLQKADLSQANLEEADLWGVKAEGAQLKAANFTNADMGWINLNAANLNNCMLNGANMRNAQIRKADLRQASMKWTQLDNALLEGSDMRSADLFTASLVRTNFKDVRLDESRLRNADMKEAELIGVSIDNVAVSEKWFEELNNWKVGGFQEIQKNYHIARDSSNQFVREKYFTLPIHGKKE